MTVSGTDCPLAGECLLLELPMGDGLIDLCGDTCLLLILCGVLKKVWVKAYKKIIESSLDYFLS